MGRKRKGKKRPTPKGSKRRRTHLRLSGETIEPRILLSATWIEGTDVDDDIRGTDGLDQIIGYAGNDRLRGQDGDDLIVAGGGDNRDIRGGSGDDIIVTGDGNNTDVRGERGDDLVVTGSGADSIRGGDGSDTLVAGGGNDTIRGERGDDTILAGAGDDVIRGDAGDDTIYTQGGSDNVHAGQGNDVIHISGHEGGDVVTVDGQQGRDSIRLAYDASEVTDDGRQLTVDLGNGESFTVNYSNIEDIEYGVNDAPYVDAGGDTTVTINAPVTLSATASDPEGDSLTYNWRQVGGPNVSLIGADTATPSFTAPPGDTILVFRVDVSDGDHTSTDLIRVTVDATNQVPSMDAGADQAVTEGDLVNLAAAASDPEGHPLTYSWTQVSGAAVNLTGATTAAPSFTAPELLRNEDLVFEATVSDGVNAVTDTVTISVQADNDGPSVDAGPDQAVTEGDLVSLAATANDPEGDWLTYMWTQVSGTPVTLTGTTTATPSFTAPELPNGEDLVFEVMVFDGTSTTTDTVTISVQADNDVPAVDAGSDQSVNEGDPVSLGATASDPEGQPLTYTWTQVSGTPVTLTGSTTPTPSFTAPELTGNQDLVFEVTASDGTNATTDTVTISVQADNDAPAVAAGSDQIVNEGDPVTLGATASDPESQPLTYTWTQVSGTPVTLTGSTTPTPSFTAPELLANEALVFQVTISDGTNTTTDTVTVTVQADNDGPTVDAGPDQTVTEGDLVSLRATASDPEGNWLTYVWTQVSGTPVTLTGSTTSTPSFTAPELTGNQDLVFEVMVFDGTSTTTDTVMVSVQADNDAPAVDAGPDQIATEGQAVTLGATVSDPEGQPLLYSWKQVSGTSVPLTAAGTATPSFTAPELLSDEDLVFEVTASDGANTTRDTVTISIRADNDGPTVDAGSDQTVSEGDLVSLGATASDPEDQGLTYLWSQVSGTPVTLSGITTATPSFSAPDLPGGENLTFEVMVFDGTNTSTDTVTISIQADDDAPAADAGPDQTVAEGDLVSLAATAGDPEGQPVTYAWTQISGTPMNVSGGTTATPSFTVPELLDNEDLIFEVTVSDGTNVTTDTVTVHVQAVDDAPTVDAGASRTVRMGDQVTLSGTATDPEGRSLTSHWTQVSGPRVTLTGGATPGFVAPSLPQDQDLVFRITTTDGTNVVTDTVAVTVLQDSTPLTVFVNNRWSADVGENVALTATASGPGYAPIEYRWIQIGGQAAILSGADTPSPSFVVPDGAEGEQLLFQLDVTVGGQSVTRSVLVEVGSAGTSQPRVDVMDIPGPVPPEMPDAPASGDTTIAALARGVRSQVLEVMEVGGRGEVTALSTAAVGSLVAEGVPAPSVEAPRTTSNPDEAGRDRSPEATVTSADVQERVRAETLPDRVAESVEVEPLEQPSMWVKVWAGLVAFLRSGVLTGKIPKS